MIVIVGRYSDEIIALTREESTEQTIEENTTKSKIEENTVQTI